MKCNSSNPPDAFSSKSKLNPSAKEFTPTVQTSTHISAPPTTLSHNQKHLMAAQITMLFTQIKKKEDNEMNEDINQLIGEVKAESEKKEKIEQIKLIYEKETLKKKLSQRAGGLGSKDGRNNNQDGWDNYDKGGRRQIYSLDRGGDNERGDVYNFKGMIFYVNLLVFFQYVLLKTYV